MLAWWVRAPLALPVGGLWVLSLAWWGWRAVARRTGPAWDAATRTLVGLVLGQAAWLVAANALGYALPPRGALVLAWALLLAAALAVDRGASLAPWAREMRQAWPWWALLAALVAYRWVVEVGVGYADERYHLALISTLATVNLPARLPFDPAQPLAYHYGFDLWAAGLVRLGGWWPWGAYDAAKALWWAVPPLLVARLTRAYTTARGAPAVAALVFVASGGTRYLLRWAPAAWQRAWDARVPLWGVSAELFPSLSQALASRFVTEGHPPIAPGFRWLNGLRAAWVFNHAGPALPAYAFWFALWLVLLSREDGAPRRTTLVVAALVAAWGLVGEASLLLFALGVGLALLAAGWRRLQPGARQSGKGRSGANPAHPPPRAGRPLAQPRPHAARAVGATRRSSGAGQGWRGWPRDEHAPSLLPPALASLPPWACGLALGLLVALVQGGTLTVAWQSRLGLLPQPAAAGTFALRWPPAFLSAHLGALPLTDPALWPVMLAEVGPWVLAVPWLYRTWWRTRPAAPWERGLWLAAGLGFVLPLVVQYRAAGGLQGSDRDMTRFATWSLTLWMLCLVWLWPRWWRSRPGLAAVVALALALSLVPAAGLTRAHLSAWARPVVAATLTPWDVRMAEQVWDRLPADARVFDPRGLRGVAVTARLGLPAAPEPAARPWPWADALRAAGFTHAYLDDRWWATTLTPAEQTAWRAACGAPVAQVVPPPEAEFWLRALALWDLRACGPRDAAAPAILTDQGGRP